MSGWFIDISSICSLEPTCCGLSLCTLFISVRSRPFQLLSLEFLPVWRVISSAHWLYWVVGLASLLTPFCTCILNNNSTCSCCCHVKSCYIILMGSPKVYTYTKYIIITITPYPLSCPFLCTEQQPPSSLLNIATFLSTKGYTILWMNSFSRMFCACELEPVLVHDTTQSLLLGTVGSLEVKLLGRLVNFFCFQSTWSFYLLDSELCSMHVWSFSIFSMKSFLIIIIIHL